jgi:hypothetical protein
MKNIKKLLNKIYKNLQEWGKAAADAAQNRN